MGYIIWILIIYLFFSIFYRHFKENKDTFFKISISKVFFFNLLIGLFFPLFSSFLEHLIKGYSHTSGFIGSLINAIPFAIFGLLVSPQDSTKKGGFIGAGIALYGLNLFAYSQAIFGSGGGGASFMPQELSVAISSFFLMPFGYIVGFFVVKFFGNQSK